MSWIQARHKLNDCWPTTSWAIVDYFLRPKPAYFAIARELRPFTVGMTRKEQKVFKDDRSAACFTINAVIEIWGTNSTLSEKKVILEVTSFDLESEWRERWSKEVALSPNSSTELYKGPLPGQPTRTSESELPKVIIVSTRLLNECGAVLARYSNWCDLTFHFQIVPNKCFQAGAVQIHQVSTCQGHRFEGSGGIGPGICDIVSTKTGQRPGSRCGWRLREMERSGHRSGTR